MRWCAALAGSRIFSARRCATSARSADAVPLARPRFFFFFFFLAGGARGSTEAALASRPRRPTRAARRSARGDRAEKISTYNFRERRVTDHRIKLTAHNLDDVLGGELDEFTAALQDDEKRRRPGGPGGGLADVDGVVAVRRRAGVREALDSALVALRDAGCDTPRLDAELLLGHALGVDRTALWLDPDREVYRRRRRGGFATRAAPHGEREPVAYLARAQGFRHLELHVDARVLVPRPETEQLVEALLTLPRGARVADVGTGSGAIALALKHERPDLEVLRHRRQRPTRSRSRARTPSALRLDVTFVQGDLLDGVDPRRSTRSCPTRPTSPTATGDAAARGRAPEPDARALRRRRRPRRDPRAARAGRGDAAPLRRARGRRRAGAPRSRALLARGRLRGRSRAARDLAGHRARGGRGGR